MIRPTPLWRSAAVIGVAGLALTACGSSSGGGSTPAAAGPSASSAPSSSTAATPTAAATTDASASQLGPVQKGDGVLKIGTLLPQTGSLAFLGPPEFAGVDLAVKDINAAGGVLGKPVVKQNSDSGDTSTDIASQSVDRLLSQKVDAIIGAASSGVSKTVIDKITGANVVEFSPANTSPDFTTYPDHGLYFRTAPSDVLQGRVLGNVILGDGYQNVAILALQDPYGDGLAANITKSVEGGGGKVVLTEHYDPKAANFSAEVSKIKAQNPDAIALVSFEEAKKIVPEMVKQGIDMKTVYFVDGNLANYSKDFPKGTLKGAKGTQPGVVASSAFQKQLLAVNPKLQEFNYAPESYDATVLIALAAEAAKNDSGTAIASMLQKVSAGGTKCTAFAACKKLVDAGTDIDYDGVSGPVEFSAQGDPTQASIGIYQYQEDNSFKFLKGQAGKL